MGMVCVNLCVLVYIVCVCVCACVCYQPEAKLVGNLRFNCKTLMSDQHSGVRTWHDPGGCLMGGLEGHVTIVG